MKKDFVRAATSEAIGALEQNGGKAVRGPEGWNIEFPEGTKEVPSTRTTEVSAAAWELPNGDRLYYVHGPYGQSLRKA